MKYRAGVLPIAALSCVGWALGMVALLGGCSHLHDYDMHLDNGIIRVGISREAYGGAITYLSRSRDDHNLVNLHDRGRQIQQSYYAGHALDRRMEGQHEAWSPWPWNPVQAGDAYGNRSAVVAAENTADHIYVKTAPLLWDMNNEPAECHMETWIQLEENVVHVHNRLSVQRTDSRWQDVAAHQELPAVYLIGELGNLYTYVGDAPFTGAALTQIVNAGPPWEYWGPGAQKPELAGVTEKWAAGVNDAGWGVGVYNSKAQLFAGGFHGERGGGAHDNATCYFTPLCHATLGKDSIYEYQYDLIIGTLAQIRDHVYAREAADQPKD